MRFSRIVLGNWRNFGQVDVALQTRAFLVGPNASGKSNFLDVFRFLRDLVVPGGGFEQAVISRGGFLRVLNMVTQLPPFPDVTIDVETSHKNKLWRYQLAFNQDENRDPVLSHERVWRDTDLVLNRPNSDDLNDPAQLRQTYLEQIFVNRPFRELADFFASVAYFHLVPQLVREPIRTGHIKNDPYGSDFVERIAHTEPEIRQVRIERILAALKLAIPQLIDLRLEHDTRGLPHLRGKFRHAWSETPPVMYSAWHDETDFSDGTLRLLGLLWSLLESDGPLLLEEPELSLHPDIVRYLPQMLWRTQRGRPNRQILLSTHSPELLWDEGISADEIVLFQPTEAGSLVQAGAEVDDIRRLLETDLTAAEAVLPYTRPENVAQLTLWGE